MKTKPVAIALVEDDAVDVMIVRRAFKKLKLASPLLVYHNGEEALAALRKPGLIPQPVLVLLDLNMPRMNGPIDQQASTRCCETVVGRNPPSLGSV